MIMLASSLVLIGIALSRWLKALILVPATLLTWGVAADYARLESLPLLQTFSVIFLAGACLQLGYFAGALLIGHRSLHAKKHALATVRR